MIQIIGLRTWVPTGQTGTKSFDAFHENNWRASSVKDLFANIDTYLEKIPPEQHWNLFYTLNNCTEQKRDFLSCNTIVFDIDGGKDLISGEEKGAVDQSRWKEYAECVAKVVKCEPEKIAVIDSGNGLHLVFMISGGPYRRKEFYKENRHHYAAISKQITVLLKEKNLGGQPDSAIFHHRAILRMPNTENRKQIKIVNSPLYYNPKYTL